MSHFAAVGLGRTEEEFHASVGLAAERGTAHSLGRRSAFHDLTDPSGAGLDVVVTDGALVCAKPTFQGAPGAQVRIRGLVADAECEWCSVLVVEVLEDGEMAYPAPVEVGDLPLVRSALGEGVECAASFALFVDERGAGEGMLAPQAAIPGGLFGTGPAVAQMLLSGEVLAAERRRNAATGATFGWARVASFGAEYDLLYDGDPPAVGTTEYAAGWLLAHLYPPPAPRRRWSRR